MSTTPKYYLAGPMTGIPQFNFPAFIDAADHLRRCGLDIVSPAEIDMEDVRCEAMASPDGKIKPNGTTSGQTWGDFLARDVKIVADECDGVVLLPCWHDSKGARLEVYVALICGKPVFAYAPHEWTGLMRLDERVLSDLVKHKPEHIQRYKERAYG
jgi:hypothetical protein